MWIEYLTEIVPGLVVLGYVLLWWQAHTDLCTLRREWNAVVQGLEARVLDLERSRQDE